MDYWPSALFPAPEVRWRLQNRVITGGMPVIGPARVSGIIGAGLWVCEMSGIWLRKKEQIRAARALDMILDGGLTPIVVGSCETAFAPWTKPSASVPHSDGSPFSDGAFYAGGAATGTVLEDAPLRATSLRIALPAGVALLGGEVFSIRHPAKNERRYGIARISGDRVTFRPELREAVPAGTTLHCHNPGCVMRLANPDEFFEPIRMGRFSGLNPVFVEAF
ncbi:hypothetical protein D3C72_317980 [compost metagenome]